MPPVGNPATQPVSENAVYILADRGITVVPDPGGKHRGWTAVREGQDQKGPFEEWIGTFYPTHGEATQAALDWKFRLAHCSFRAAKHLFVCYAWDQINLHRIQ